MFVQLADGKNCTKNWTISKWGTTADEIGYEELISHIQETIKALQAEAQ